MLGMSIYGFSKGNMQKLVAPTNSDGELCGFGVNKEFKYLYYYNIEGVNMTKTGVCVNTCPNSKDFQFPSNGGCKTTETVKSC